MPNEIVFENEIKLSSYLDDLINQYIKHQTKIYIIFLIVISLISGFFIIPFLWKSNLFSFVYLQISFSYSIIIFVIAVIIFGPYLILNRFIIIYPFKPMIKAYNEKNFTKISNLLEKHSLRFLIHKDETLLDYFQSVDLIIKHQYNDAYKKLEESSKSLLKSVLFKYEIYNLMGQCLTRTGDSEKGKKFITDALSGYEKLKFEPGISFTKKLSVEFMTKSN